MLRGRIVAAGNDAALRRVRVAVTFPSGRVDPVLTDDDGRFVFTLPSRAAVTVTATKAGYAAMTEAVSASAIDDALTLRMVRGATISGRLVDAAGAPVAEMQVAVRRSEAATGELQHVTTTDDLGEYRLGGLQAGRYLLLTGSVPSLTMIGGGPSSTPVPVRVASRAM